MTMRCLLLPFALFALSACTPMQWMRDGAVPSAELLEQDSSSCRQNAWREAQYRAWAYRPYGSMVPFAGGRRFIGWPYGPAAYPFGDPFFEEARLTDFCMRAKGYELVPIEKPEPPQKPPN
jgi:hypothetical protein